MHTVCEVGFWSNPKVMAFAKKCRNPDAGAWILRVREFVLLHGTADGKLTDYSADDIVAVMQPTCPPARMLKAAAEGNFLKRWKKKTWVIPTWKTSQMGKYCEDREWDRQRKKEEREAAKAAKLAKIAGNANGTSGGHPVDGPGTSSGNPTVSKVVSPSGEPPAGPSGAGEGGAEARWDWFSKTHPRLGNPVKCKRLLAQMTDAEWDQLHDALPIQLVIYKSRSRHKWAWADKYLERGMYWEIPKESPRKSVTKPKVDSGAFKPTPADDEMKAFALRQLNECLADPEATPDMKENRKNAYFARWKEKPWETATKAPAGKPHHQHKPKSAEAAA